MTLIKRVGLGRRMSWQEYDGNLEHVARAGGRFEDAAAFFADTVLTYAAAQPGTVTEGEVIRSSKEGFAWEVAASAASDHDASTAGGVKLYVLPRDGRVFASQFNVFPATSSLGTAIGTALEAAASICGEFVFDRETYTVTGIAEENDRIRIADVTGLKVVVPKGCRIESAFDIGADGVTNLFGFLNCNDITITGDGEVEVVVANNPPPSRVTFAVFYFNNSVTSGPDNVKFLGPLKAVLRGAVGDPDWTYPGYDSYAGYVIRMSSANDPAPQPTGFVCAGCDFNGSSGRIIQTQGTIGARIVNNSLEKIGEHFVTVGIRSLGDTERQLISGNSISAADKPEGLFSAITIGTLDVGRNSAAMNCLITDNLITLAPTHASGGSRGVAVNASSNVTVRNNVITSDRDNTSYGVRVELTATEIANGVASLTNTTVENNSFVNIDAPLFINTVPEGGTISGVIYRRNRQVNCGDIGAGTIALAEIVEL